MTASDDYYLTCFVHILFWESGRWKTYFEEKYVTKPKIEILTLDSRFVIKNQNDFFKVLRISLKYL